MASSDVVLQSYVKTFFVPLVVFLILVRLSRRQLKKIYLKFYAYVIYKFSLSYNKKLGSRKEKLFLGLHEQATQSDRRISILEVGAGGGANFKYYPKNANVTCVDPNPEFGKYLERTHAEYPGVNLVETAVGTAEDMSAIPSGSVDAVVCTLVLCTVNNTDGALKEIIRVLRPGGKFYFLEHVSADDNTWLYRAQRVLTPVWRVLGDGCELNRKTWTMIETANFSQVNLERFRAEIRMPLLRPHIVGTAMK